MENNNIIVFRVITCHIYKKGTNYTNNERFGYKSYHWTLIENAISKAHTMILHSSITFKKNEITNSFSQFDFAVFLKSKYVKYFSIKQSS